MNSTFALGGIAAFLGGISAALLASYPIPQNSLYVCFCALFIALAACIVGACAIALYTSKRNKVEVESDLVRAVDQIVEYLLEEKHLKLVDRD